MLFIFSSIELKVSNFYYVAQVGTNGDEGYCVNVPWSCGGVDDNVYIYAFQQVVIPIGTLHSRVLLFPDEFV